MNGVCGGVVEIAGRLISKNDIGIIAKSPRYGNPLLLSTGKLLGNLMRVIFKPYKVNEFFRSLYNVLIPRLLITWQSLQAS